MSSYQYTTIIVILSSLMSACGLTPKKPTDSNLARNGYIEIERWLDAAITRRMKKADITGLGIALVDQDRIVLHKAYGWADKAAKRPVSRDTRFRAGSVTKPFTSIAVHQLAERGAIDLDAPLSDSIAEFRIGSRFPDASEPTLRQVLSHYAGLPSDNLNGMWTNKPANLDSVSEYLATQYLTSSPGTVMAYSNLGYSMAGLAIERVSGLPYAEFMQQRVLDPLQMTASNVMFNTSHSTMSESYIDGEHVIEPGLRDLPAGGLVTTTGDLSKMVMAILNNGNLPGSKIEQLIAPHTLNSMVSVPTFSSPQSFGNLSALGWIRQSGILPRGDDLIWHNGQTLAHSALVQISRNAGLGIVLLSNSPAVEALDQIAKELIDLAYTVKFGAGVEKNQSPQAISNEQLPGSAAAPEGAFASIAGLVKLTPSGNNFNARLAGQTWQLQPISTGGYKVKLKLLGRIPVSNKALNEITLHFRKVDKRTTNETLVFLQHKVAWQLLASSVAHQNQDTVWLTRLGDYQLADSDFPDSKLLRLGPARLTEEDGIYCVAITFNDEELVLPLAFHTNDEATIQGYGRNHGETLRFISDNTFQLLGLRFTRTKAD